VSPSTVPAVPAEPAESVEPATAASRTFGRAFGDLTAGWRHRQLWGHLGWQDIKQRYRRSVLGPLWITISMAVTAVALGLLYSQLFGQEPGFFLPYVTVGFIVWGFISGCINEGAEVFIANEGLIKHLPSPISVHVFRLVWRQSLFFVHNLAVYLLMITIFWDSLAVSGTVLLAVPAFALLMLNGGWVALLVGIVSTRFRDIPPVTQSIVTLMFFMTPIVWVYDQLLEDPRTAPRARYVELNPFLHYVEIIRRPMLGQSIEAKHWLVVGAVTLVGWLLALLFLRNYRARVSYWVGEGGLGATASEHRRPRSGRGAERARSRTIGPSGFDRSP
jgi:ABC-type polysaccharide/polyol phosphate export permease